LKDLNLLDRYRNNPREKDAIDQVGKMLPSNTLKKKIIISLEEKWSFMIDIYMNQ
jgi:hypothetical protein